MLKFAQVLARTGDDLVDFAPYVPVLDPEGRAVFQATRADGSSVICRDSSIISAPSLPAASHPVAGPRLGYFARAGTRNALAIDGAIDDTGLDFGPAGPTINARGDIAARARDGSVEVIVLATARGLEVVARGGHYEGLAVVLDDGRVVFHERGEGLRGVPWQREGMQRFFGANNHGQVAVATQSGIWLDEVRLISRGFVSHRSAALDDLGHVVHASTAAGGKLGVYAGKERLVGLGDALEGSTVTDLAFNQASLRPDGRLAVRVALADGRGLILGWRL